MGSVPLQSRGTMLLQAVLSSSWVMMTLVFYTSATLLPISGAYSIVSLLISCVLSRVFLPIICENAAAVPFNGGNYSYLLNFSSKNAAIVAAAITFLDAITTVPIREKRVNCRPSCQLVALAATSRARSLCRFQCQFSRSSFSSPSHAFVYWESENPVVWL